MSICANIYCLFKAAPSQERLTEVQKLIWNRLGYADDFQPQSSEYGVLSPTWDVDHDYDFGKDGTISERNNYRVGVLMGELPRQERFYGIHYLTRWWSEDYPEGPMLQYVATLLTLLQQDDIEWVWYAPDQKRSMAAMTVKGVYDMLETYIRIGQR